MSVVTTEKQTTLVAESATTETVVTEQTSNTTVQQLQQQVVTVEELGNIVQDSQEQELVVLGGYQGIPGAPGASTQFEYALAAETLGGNRAVTTNPSGLLIYPDQTSLTCRVYGITTQSATAGELVEVQITGTQEEPSWNWTPGEPIYLGVGGLLTQQVPLSGQIIVVGYAQSATKLFIDKQPAVFAG